MMDALTPKGQGAIAHARDAAMIWTRCHEAMFFETDQNKPACVDGILIFNNIISRIVEIKARNMGERQFRKEYNSEWLITKQKIDEACVVARMLRAPLMGWLYLVEDKLLLAKTLTDDLGVISCKHRVDTTETQATCNGGTAVRENYFFDMSNAARMT